MEITGTGPWSRALRHDVRMDQVRSLVHDWVDQYDGEKPLMFWLLWAEANPAHIKGPGRTVPTARPDWWVQSGLPDRRHRRSGAAWTAAAAGAAERELGPYPRASFPSQASAVYAHTWLMGANHTKDAAELAAAICQTLADGYSKSNPTCLFGFDVPGGMSNSEYRQAIATCLGEWEDRLQQSLASIADELAEMEQGL